MPSTLHDEFELLALLRASGELLDEIPDGAALSEIAAQVARANALMDRAGALLARLQAARLAEPPHPGESRH